MKVTLRGHDLLTHPHFNKGTAFTHEERRALGLEGLLPERVFTMEEQVQRMAAAIARKEDPLEQYIGLASLHDRNEHLYYRLLIERVEELLPIVYTPTVGLACQRYSQIFRRPFGVWITPTHRGRIAEILRRAAPPDVQLIVVTDNERILGLGDQGAGGMGIPVGKLSLYTVAAGIHPQKTLPISLDVGTDNDRLLADPLYLGWRNRRLRGEPYDELVEEFVQAVKECFPEVLLQWEDFKKGNAFRLLDRYRETLPSFNDDIQGTAAVASAGVLAAVRATRVSLSDERFVMFGAGAAGVGIARQLRDALARGGVTGDDLTRSIAVLDSRGMLIADREMDEPHKLDFTWPVELARAAGLEPGTPQDLATVVEKLRPTVLIGTSGQPGTFTEPIIRTMARHVERPVIFPLSNPTSKSEAVPADLIAWTEGRALIATGSPFKPVQYEGRSITISQGNNVYIFPGVGLGAIVARARIVTDSMLTAAAETLAGAIGDDELATGALYPRLTQLRAVTAKIAAAVVREVRESGVGEAIPDPDIPGRVAEAMWEPVYPKLEPA